MKGAILSPSTIVVTVLSAIVSIPVVWIIAADPDDLVEPIGWYAMLPGVVPTAWVVLQAVWSRDPDRSGIMVALARTLAIPFIAAPVGAVANTVVVALPPVMDRVRAAQADGHHYWFAADAGHPVVQTLGLGLIAGLFASMLVGLALSVFVVLPAIAFVRPRQAIADNMLNGAPEHEAANTAVMRVFALMVMIIFASPTLIVVGANSASADGIGELFGGIGYYVAAPGDHLAEWSWLLGMALIPLGLLAGGFVWSRQRVDHAARDQLGRFRGLPNPRDQR